MDDEEILALFTFEPEELLPAALSPYPLDVLDEWFDLSRAPVMAGADWLDDLGALLEPFRKLWDTIWGGLGGALRWVWDHTSYGLIWLRERVEDLFEWVQDKVGEGVGWLTDRLVDARDYLWRSLASGIGLLAHPGRTLVDLVWDRVTDAASWTWDQVSGAVDFLWDKASYSLAFIRDQVGNLYDWVEDRVTDAAGWLWDKASFSLIFIRDQVGNLYDFVDDKVTDAASWTKDNVLTPVMAGMGSIGDAFEPFVDVVQFKLSIPGKLIRGEYEDLGQLAEDIMDPAPIVLAGVVGLLVLTMVVSLALSSLFTTFLEPLAEPNLQDSRARVGAQLPTVTQTFDAWNRGLIGEGDADDILSRYGFAGTRKDALKQLRYLLPTPTDLVRFGVREVFTPAVAERFGQYQDFPDAFGTEMAKVGFDLDRARQFWAAHWDLPSLSAGYEMLHRRVIDQSDLELLLRAQDVMPYWRDKLIRISYNPLTRVDVRRMYALGVLNEQAVHDAYLDLGYNEENATRLTEFTKRYSAPDEDGELKDFRDLAAGTIRQAYRRHVLSRDEALDKLVLGGYTEDVADFLLTIDDVQLGLRPDLDSDVDVRELTLSIIRRAYREGLWERSRAQEELEALGYLPNAADLILALEDLDKERELTETRIKLVKERFLAFDLDEAGARSELQDLEVQEDRLELLITDWTADRQPNVRRLTTAQLKKAWGVGLYNDQEVFDYLRLLGYPDAEADILMQVL